MSIKVSQLGAATTTDANDLLYLVDVSEGTGGSKSITIENMRVSMQVGVQPLDADLTALSLLDGATKGDMIIASATNTWARHPHPGDPGTAFRALTATANQTLTWQNLGTAANHDASYFALAAHTHAYQLLDEDLTAIAALNSTGYLKRTGTNAWGLVTSIPWSDITGAPGGFTPVAHAVTHELGGADELELAISQITGLQTALDGKQPLADVLTQISAMSGTDAGVMVYDAGDTEWQKRIIPGSPNPSGYVTILGITAGEVEWVDVPLSSGVVGTGTVGRIPKYVTTGSIGNSKIAENISGSYVVSIVSTLASDVNLNFTHTAGVTDDYIITRMQPAYIHNIASICYGDETNNAVSKLSGGWLSGTTRKVDWTISRKYSGGTKYVSLDGAKDYESGSNAIVIGDTSTVSIGGLSSVARFTVMSGSETIAATDLLASTLYVANGNIISGGSVFCFGNASGCSLTLKGTNSSYSGLVSDLNLGLGGANRWCLRGYGGSYSVPLTLDFVFDDGAFEGAHLRLSASASGPIIGSTLTFSTTLSYSYEMASINSDGLIEGMQITPGTRAGTVDPKIYLVSTYNSGTGNLELYTNDALRLRVGRYGTVYCYTGTYDHTDTILNIGSTDNVNYYLKIGRYYDGTNSSFEIDTQGTGNFGRLYILRNHQAVDNYVVFGSDLTVGGTTIFGAGRFNSIYGNFSGGLHIAGPSLVTDSEYLDIGNQFQVNGYSAFVAGNTDGVLLGADKSGFDITDDHTKFGGLWGHSYDTDAVSVALLQYYTSGSIADIVIGGNHASAPSNRRCATTVRLEAVTDISHTAYDAYFELNGTTKRASLLGYYLRVQDPDDINKGVYLYSGGCYAIKVQAGEAMSAGHVVCIKQSGGADNKVWKCPTSGNENLYPCGIIMSDVSADAWCIMCIAGICYVKPESGVTATRGYALLASTSTAGTVSEIASQTTYYAQKIGNWLDTGSGAGVATRAIVHFC